jgi:hypothetical protein
MDVDHQPRDDEGREPMPSADIFAGLDVRSPLRRKAMLHPDPQREAWRFQRMSTWELQRENNVALNNETFVRLGLNKTFEEAIGLPSKKGEKRKRGEKNAGRKSKRQRERAEEGGYDDEEDEDEELEEDGDLPTAGDPRPQRAKPVAKPVAVKEWARKARALLEEKNFGPEWMELVEVWFQREEKKGFVSPVSFPANIPRGWYIQMLTRPS